MSMPFTDHRTLLTALRREYSERFARSGATYADACKVLVDGTSHGARLFDPFPFYAAEAGGAYLTTVDGRPLVDYWQGHYANILGHNPELIRRALGAALLERGYGLQVGMPDTLQVEFARLLARATGAEMVRLTTAGTLATLYATMLARAYTRRPLVVKISGGWHGANPLVLKGVQRDAQGYDHVDSSGLPAATDQEIALARFNDVEGLGELFDRHGERVACLIMEPCVGGAGFVAATPDFMRAARELTSRYGALLILDEVITGFRFCAGGAQRLYGVQADLSTYGKIIGGGMPLSAVVGRADVLSLAGRSAEPRVWFNGGTFSEHPLALLAGLTLLQHLVEREDSIYPALAEHGHKLRRAVEAAFSAHGILARCTGDGNEALRGGSLGAIYFPRDEAAVPRSSEDWSDPATTDVALREQALKLGLLLEGVHVMHGLGAVSTRHDDETLAHTAAACDAFARRLKQAAT